MYRNFRELSPMQESDFSYGFYITYVFSFPGIVRSGYRVCPSLASGWLVHAVPFPIGIQKSNQSISVLLN